MQKRIITIFIVVIMVIGLLAACGDRNTGSSASNQTVSGNFNPTGYPIVNEEIVFTLGWFGDRDYMSEDPLDTFAWKKFYELTNMRFEVDFINESDDGTAANLWFAAMDYPDITLGGWPFTQARIDTYAVEGGLFEDWTPLINEWMPNLKSLMDTEPMILPTIRQMNGKIYTLPQLSKSSTDYTGYHFYRTDYLDELNITEATTIDGFYDNLKAVMDAGLTNGKAPFLPYTDGGMQNQHMRTHVMDFFFPAFGPGIDWQWGDNGDGKVVLNAISDQYRLTLEFLNKLFVDGLLDNEVFSMDIDSMYSRINTGEVFVSTVFHTIRPEDFPANDGTVHVSAYSPLTSQYQNTKRIIGVPMVSTWCGALNINSQYKNEIARWMDIAFAQEEVAPGTGIDRLTMSWGIEGINYNLVDGTLVWAFESDLPWQYLRQNIAWGTIIGDRRLLALGTDPNNFAREYAMVNKLGPYNVPFFPNLQIKHTQEETDAISTNLTDMTLYILEEQAKFIAGTRPFTDWDDYVNTIQNMQLIKITEAKQAAYDRWNE